MRKCLGVLVVAVLCAAAWAQAPAQAPAPDPAQAPASSPPPSNPDAGQTQAPNAPAPQTAPESTSIPLPAKPHTANYPRTELFVGYSFAQAGFFNAGHWAQLNGWDASFGLNVTNLLGLVGDGGEYFGNSQIPGGTPAPFPTTLAPYCTSGPACTFDADTREYNILFGPQFAYRKHARWTPFGELMAGHDGVRGIAHAPAGYVSEVSSGLAVVAGGGFDHPITERYALRIKADYLQTRTDFSALGKAKQDNLRVSVGVVIRSVRKKRRKLEDETEPEP